MVKDNNFDFSPAVRKIVWGVWYAGYCAIVLSSGVCSFQKACVRSNWRGRPLKASEHPYLVGGPLVGRFHTGEARNIPHDVASPEDIPEQQVLPQQVVSADPLAAPSSKRIITDDVS